MISPTEILRAAIPAAIAAGKAIMEIYGRPTEEWGVEEKADHSPLTKADLAANTVITEALSKTPWPILSEEGAQKPYEERRAWDTLWVVDPLDGTKEFLKRNGEFTVNIALVENGSPVAGVIYVPVTQTLYFGVVGLGAYKLGDASVAKDEAKMIRSAQRLPAERTASEYIVVASRSHINAETQAFIDELRKDHPHLEQISAGSSLKLCRVAEGSADVYPRFAPTMEWDTAAGDAIVRAAGGTVVDATAKEPLVYNKEDLHNPFFIVEMNK